MLVSAGSAGSWRRSDCCGRMTERNWRTIMAQMHGISTSRDSNATHWFPQRSCAKSTFFQPLDSRWFFYICVILHDFCLEIINLWCFLDTLQLGFMLGYMRNRMRHERHHFDFFVSLLSLFLPMPVGTLRSRWWFPWMAFGQGVDDRFASYGRLPFPWGFIQNN